MKHQLFSSSLPFPSSLLYFLVLGREQQCLNSLFLHLSIRSLSSLYIELFSFLESSKKSLSNFQALLLLVSLPLSCSRLRGSAARYESSCSKSPWCYCCCMQDIPQDFWISNQSATKTEAESDSSQLNNGVPQLRLHVSSFSSTSQAWVLSFSCLHTQQCPCSPNSIRAGFWKQLLLQVKPYYNTWQR